MQLCLNSPIKDRQLQSLSSCAKACDLCPRMNGRTKVLSHLNGNVNSKVLFIAEAPGRLGADRTAIPLFGDAAGKNFETLLTRIDWKREWVFITNAVLCNPREENGNNSTPNETEIANCSAFLQMTLNVVEPEVIVTLGAAALKSLAHVQRHSYSLREHVGCTVDWYGRKLFVAYHTGQRATLHRSSANQIADFYKLSRVVHPLNGLLDRRPRQRSRAVSLPSRLDALSHAITYFAQSLGQLAKFKLVKLLYLADFEAQVTTGKTITGVAYLRQQDGPWPPDIDKALKHLDGHEIGLKNGRRIPFIVAGPNPRLQLDLPEEHVQILHAVCSKYGGYSTSQIKAAAYSTSPMRQVLKDERDGENRLNLVVLK